MSLRSRAKNVLRDVCFERKRAALWRRRAHSTKEDSFEINLKLRKRKSDDSQTPREGHTLRKIKERNILPQRYGVKGTKAPAHHLCGVLLCVSSTPFLFLSLSLSSHFSHANARRTRRTKTFGRATDKSKTSGTLGGGVRKEEYKIDFPERNKNIKKWSWGSETELYL